MFTNIILHHLSSIYSQVPNGSSICDKRSLLMFDNIMYKKIVITMKGPRKREASQPATDSNLRLPPEKG